MEAVERGEKKYHAGDGEHIRKSLENALSNFF
jgi:hypothetical protein